MKTTAAALACVLGASSISSRAAGPAQQLSSEPSIPATVIRQAGGSFALADHVQKILFVKTESGNSKDAIADLLLSDIGLNLITMGMASQMKMWNPYLGDTLGKVRTVGKGLLHSRGSDTQGFEYSTLPGTTASVGVREGKPEVYIAIEQFAGAAEVDAGAIQPVLLRLESREKDQLRLLTTRHVIIKESKKGRFDFKPVIERVEDFVEQNVVPIDAQLTPGRVYQIVPKQDLTAGEYALVFRSRASSGAFTMDVPLKPTSVPSDAQDVAAAEQPQSRGGLFRRGKAAQPAPSQEQAGSVGFLAWDFRVLR